MSPTRRDVLKIGGGGVVGWLIGSQTNVVNEAGDAAGGAADYVIGGAQDTADDVGDAVGDALGGGDKKQRQQQQEYELVLGDPVTDTVKIPADNGSTYEGFVREELDSDVGYLEYSVVGAEPRPYFDVQVMPESAFTDFTENREYDVFDNLSEDHTSEAHERGQLPAVDEDYAFVVDNSTRGPTDPTGEPITVEIEYVTGTYEPVNTQNSSQ